MEITVLLDYMRGSRNKINSRTMLEPLLKCRQNSEVYLYHTPKLRGLLKRLLPDRFNELIGVQHMKLYLFDDTLIISGWAKSLQFWFWNSAAWWTLSVTCVCNFAELIWVTIISQIGRIDTWWSRTVRTSAIFITNWSGSLPNLVTNSRQMAAPFGTQTWRTLSRIRIGLLRKLRKEWKVCSRKRSKNGQRKQVLIRITKRIIDFYWLK